MDDQERDHYSREVTALTSEMAQVSEHLALISKMREEVQSAVRQSSSALISIEQRLAACPPAMPPGTTLPLEMYFQVIRSKWSSNMTKPLDQGVDVVLAHCIPQSKRHEIFFNQIIPTEYLSKLRSPVQGKNSSQLYSSWLGRRNSRAMVHAQEGAGEIIFGNVYWVPSPLKTERWFPLVVEKPSQDEIKSTKVMIESTRSLHNIAIYRFTIDTLPNGTLLSFAKEDDRIHAKMALSG